MKKEEFCEIFGDISESYVKEARAGRKAPKTNWLKWGAAAACLAIILFMGIPCSVQYLHNDEEGRDAGYIVATKMTFQAKVIEVQENALLVEPFEGTEERGLAATILIPIDETIGEIKSVEYLAAAQAGDIVQISYLKEDSDIRKGIIAVCEIVPIGAEYDGNSDEYSPIPDHHDEEFLEQDPEAN
ncbi:MAG TPA: hypothetical protein IAB55_01865 [Candidatus Merdivicinus faecavium]|nr:hypothetical protein [Candidatus Merdivicinus faecavium]